MITVAVAVEEDDHDGDASPAPWTVPPWWFLSSLSSLSSTSSSSTTDVTRCLFTIVGLPTALLIVAIVLGIAQTSTGFPYFFFFVFTGGRSRTESSSLSSSSGADYYHHGLLAWRRRMARAHRRRRQQRNDVDDDDNDTDDDDDDDTDIDDGEMPARERASYVPMLAILVGQQLLTTAFTVLWNDANDNAPSITQQQDDGATKHHVDVSAAAAVDVASSFDPRRRWDRGVHWARASIFTLLLVGVYLWGVIRRPVGVSAIGVPALVAVSVRQLWVKLYDPHHQRIRSIDEWAIHEKYWQTIGGSEDQSHDESATPNNVSLLAQIAVFADAAFWSVLLPTLLVRAYQRLFSHAFKTGSRALLGFVKTLLHGPGASNNSIVTDDAEAEEAPSRWERVHRIYSRYDVSVSVADEYCLTNPSRASPIMARRVFQRMERAYNDSRSYIAVWLGDDLCLCNFAPPVPRADPRTGRVLLTSTTATSVIALETIAFVMLPGDEPHMWVCGTSSALANAEGGADGESSIVSAMDSFFRLLALQWHRQGGNGTCLLQMSRDENFAGRSFPVSRRGLRFLVQDPDPDPRRRSSTSLRRQGKRVLNVHSLGLTVDQWRWLLQGVPGPHVELWFYGTDYASCPEPFRGLVQALRDDQCAARISVSGADRLPSDVLEGLACAIEQNRSVTELYMGVSTHVVRPSIREDHRDGRRTSTSTYEVTDSAAYRILQALARRSSPLDVLELHVSVFTSRTWAFLWESVVPSRALNLKCLKLVTGIGTNLTSALPTDAVNEDEMIRFVCQSQSLCSFEFLNVNVRGTAGYAERIADSVGVYLRFNLFRRLVRTLENEPDVEVRSRWVATLLVRSVMCRNPSWCYHVLQHNASEDWLERPWM